MLLETARIPSFFFKDIRVITFYNPAGNYPPRMFGVFLVPKRTFSGKVGAMTLVVKNLDSGI